MRLGKIASGGGKTAVLMGLLSVGLLCGVVLAVCVGKYPVTPKESLRILFSVVFRQPVTASDMTVNVVLGLRIPRILASVFVGGALSVAGAAYQGIFQNPLVSPDFLGVSSGACVGAAFAILMSLTTVFISLFAFIGGILAFMLTISLPALLRNRSNTVLVLAGIIVGSALSSLLGFIKYTADPDTQLASITYWTMGSFAYVSLRDLAFLIPLLIVPMTILILMAWWIDVLSMGEEEARTLGADVTKMRGIVILCSTLLTAGSVCIAGTISWVGLIVPHFARMVVGSGNRRLIPFSALLGGFFMLLVDTLTRIIGVSEMPVSIMTGVLGSFFFYWLIWRQRDRIR